MKLALIILEVISSIALIVVIMLQSGKEDGMSALTGGNSNSYLSKSKYGSLDKILAVATKWVTLVWILLTLALSLI